MSKTFIQEIKFFFNNLINMRFKSLLFIILLLLIIPLFFVDHIKTMYNSSLNNTIRFVAIYLLNIYHLIIIYNKRIIETMGEELDIDLRQHIIQELRIGGQPLNEHDIINRIAQQIGFDINNIIDFQIIQIPNPNHIINEGGNNNEQNVHDTSVQAHLTRSIDLIKDKVKVTKTNDEVVNEIKTYIYSNCTNIKNDIKDKAISTLKLMTKVNGFIARINMKELDILNLVWTRITDDINKNNINNLKENLIVNLADCIKEDESGYCLQGRIARIIQSLECLDKEQIVNIKPLYAVKDEIAHQCGKLRNKLYDSLTPEQKNKYNNSNDSKISDKMKQVINNKLYKKYVDTNILTSDQYNNIVKDFLVAI